MSDTSKLLNQLRIERDPLPPAASAVSRQGLWLGLGGAVVVAAALSGYALLRPHQAEAVSEQTAASSPAKSATSSPVIAAAAPAASDNAVLNASGYIVARRSATVSAKLTAKVNEVLIDEGQTIKAGDVMAVLDDTNLRAAYEYSRSQLEQIKASQRAAQVAFDNEAPFFKRMQQQHERNISSQQDFDTAKARYDASRASLDVASYSVAVAEASLAIANRNLEDTKVRAPFSGVVTVKAAQPGEMVSPNSAGGGFTRTGIGTIVDMASLEAEVDVSENFINRISEGQSVTIKLNAYPEWEIPGHVITVIPTADRAKATVKVRVALDNHDSRILPDMGARVSFLRKP